MPVCVCVCGVCLRSSVPPVNWHWWAYQPFRTMRCLTEVSALHDDNSLLKPTSASHSPEQPFSVRFQRSEKTEWFSSFKHRCLDEGTVICHWDAETRGVFWAIDSRWPKPFHWREGTQGGKKPGGSHSCGWNTNIWRIFRAFASL